MFGLLHKVRIDSNESEVITVVTMQWTMLCSEAFCFCPAWLTPQSLRQEQNVPSKYQLTSTG
jgi:hypothetical protein